MSEKHRAEYDKLRGMEIYFDDLRVGVEKEYLVAGKARGKGLDPVDEVETPLALNMAEKAVNLVVTIYPDLPVKKIAERILKLEEEYGKLDTTVAFVIAREIAENKFHSFKDKLEGIDCGIRVGFAYLTLGVVASPIEGYTGIELGKTKDNKDYFVASFSGPIRSAGTTATCLVLMLIDYLREHFGYAKYDSTKEEVGRYIAENFDYHERVNNLAYLPTEEEMGFLASRLPIQISGDPTEKIEVSNYKDLARIETNFIRGGMCLAFSEGLAQKAEKALGRLRSCRENGLICTGWDFLYDYLEVHKKREKGDEDVTATYINDLVAGRPVYGHPSRSGGFRFRYGRGRTEGFSAVSIHPATMGVSGGFLSNGTQLKPERPTKGCIITSCDSIDGPIVKLRDGSVKKLHDFGKAKDLYDNIEEIIYLGDILFPLGDVMDRNQDLLKPGYVEEWWELELKEKLAITGENFNEVFDGEITFEKTKGISEKYNLPVHPKFIFYWSQISKEDFFLLMDWLQNGICKGGASDSTSLSVESERKLVLPWSKGAREEFKGAKRALELLGVEHLVVFDNVVIDEDSQGFLSNLGLDFRRDGVILKEDILKIIESQKNKGDVLGIVNSLSQFKIKDKAGSFIGARMARPEKAKLRKLSGSPNGLFPVSDQGGRLSSVQEACNIGFVKSDWPICKCKCGNDTIYPTCEKCGKKTSRFFYCRDCRETKNTPCTNHDNNRGFLNRKIEVKDYFDSTIKLLGYKDFEIPPLIKGVRSLSNEDKDFEHLGKAVLRAKFNLSVNKDGTIRYDGTEVPITHFKPKEIRVGVEKLKELGYVSDIEGNELVDDDQILEIMPHDVILPSCSVTNDERADDVFLNIANFIDEELERLYKLPRHYNLNGKSDLIGQLVVCMAPHNCAGVVGRIIGFTEIQGLVASPYMHAAMRRDCDGDEAAVMMLMDVLINFSRKFLPSHRGGRQDAPLVLNARIKAGEVDDQILNLETCSSYPLEVYRMAEKGEHSSNCNIETVRTRLADGMSPFVGTGFTHNTEDFNAGFVNGAYKTLPTMKDKVAKQMELVGKIRAVDTEDVARLVIERHFIRDIRGNLRKFSRQRFRCSKCNEKYRRPPLSGICKCGGKIIFTISEGSIKKYLDPALELANNYNISSYTKEGLELTKEYIESIFGKTIEEQKGLADF
jgi:DNA polymerase II large subunit